MKKRFVKKSIALALAGLMSVVSAPSTLPVLAQENESINEAASETETPSEYVFVTTVSYVDENGEW